ncbi:MAG: hypothetical protein H6706_25815 [Myxococcales bacterium]|nr:hypothetical protein [Myxococcales bacterium]
MNALLRLALAVALAPLCAAWSGHGTGLVEWAPDTQGAGTSLDVDVVGAAHEDAIEAILVLPVPGLTGDGVLTLRFDRALRNRGATRLPHPGVQVRFREYAADGTTLFRALRAEGGEVELTGGAAGPLHARFSVALADGLQTRRISGSFEMLPVSVEREEIDDPTTDEVDVVYVHDNGCYGTYDEEPEDDALYWEDDTTDEGCGGDDLDDDGPSGSGGCDDSASEGDAYGDDGAGCEGDNVDGDSGSSCSGCSGDDLDVAVVGCARLGGPPRGGGPRSRWLGRLIGWLPWFTVFLVVGWMRRRARRAVAAA